MFSCNDVTVFVVLLYPDHILMLCNVAGLAHTTYLHTPTSEFSVAIFHALLFRYIYLQGLLQCRYIYNCKLAIVDCPDNCDGALMMMHDPGCRDK